MNPYSQHLYRAPATPIYGPHQLRHYLDNSIKISCSKYLKFKLHFQRYGSVSIDFLHVKKRLVEYYLQRSVFFKIFNIHKFNQMVHAAVMKLFYKKKICRVIIYQYSLFMHFKSTCILLMQFRNEICGTALLCPALISAEQ